MLKSLAKIAAGGGAGLSDDLPDVLTELQGLTFSLLAGVGAGVRNNLAAIRPEDTIVAALNNNAGTITDIKATTSIGTCTASGTATLSGVTAGQTITVAGLTYTAVSGVAADNTKFSVDGNDTADAAALAAAINSRESQRVQQVSASSNAGVVTITASAEGTAGNSIALTKVAAGITLSGATLAGGTATGGIIVTGATNQVLLLWFNKR